MSLRITPAVRQDFRRFNLAQERARAEYRRHPFSALGKRGHTSECAAEGCPDGMRRMAVDAARSRRWRAKKRKEAKS